jgi:hypothetical protein
MITQQHHGILRYIIPRYDEVSLFAMSLTCTLLLVVGLFSTSQVQFDLSTMNLKLFLVVLIFFAGLVLSIYHALVNTPKSSVEKFCMLVFAVIVNAFSGLLRGIYAFNWATGWLSIFPVVNIVNGILLLFLFRTHALTESDISDEHALHIQVAFTAAVVIIMFIVCNYISKLMWIQTLSICVAYATNIGRRVQVLFWWLPSKNKTA